MKYMGSKNRIAKHLLPIINPKKIINYVEPFVGGCNLIDKVKATNKLAGDGNPYLIAMWKELQAGWVPPKEITRDMYNYARTCYMENSNKMSKHYIGYIGFSGSYGGRFYEGGYAGITTTKAGKIRNYPVEAFKNIKAQCDKIHGIEFIHCDYKDLPLQPNSIIYCDPPYSGTKEYAKSGFDSLEFWQWCRDKSLQGHKIYISEYNAPDDFKCVWSKGVSSSLSANGKIGGNKVSTEKLFTIGTR